MDSRPLSFESFPVSGFGFRVLSACESAGNKHSLMSVLLPEPLTPVTTTKRPNGNFTVTSCKLFFAAWCNVIHPCFPLFTGRRSPRVGYFLCARRHFPVNDSGCCNNSFNV